MRVEVAYELTKRNSIKTKQDNIFRKKKNSKRIIINKMIKQMANPAMVLKKLYKYKIEL